MKLEFTPGWSGIAWCSKENAHKVMDVELAKEVERIANKRLEEMLSEAPVVYGCDVGALNEHWCPELYERTDTHKARLVNIEELK